MNTQSTKATIPCPYCGRLNRVAMDRVQDQPKCGACGRPLALDKPLPVTDGNFARVIADSGVPVLVDFYADWCQPCKIMAPMLDEIARNHLGKLLVLKLDTDKNQATAQRFSIRGIPTLILFEGGREVAREVGAVPRPRLEALIQKAGSGYATTQSK